MNAGVRLKLFAITLALVVVVGLVCGAYMERGLRAWLMGRIETELLGQARVGRDLVELLPALGSDEVADRLADRLGSSTQARVTIVRADGAVLGDSELSLAEVRHVENHLHRPEIEQALAAGQGAAMRYSTSVRHDMFYAAVPYQRADGHGAIRVAMPLAEVGSTVRRLRLMLLVAGVVGLVLAVVISGVASHLASRPLRNLVRNARLWRSSGAAQRLPVSSNDELGRLAGSFNELVGELDQTLKSLGGERDRLETILEGMTEALLSLDSDDRVTHVNRAAMELLGLAQSPVGQVLIEVLRVPALAELIERVHRERGAPAESELSLPPSRSVLARAAKIKSTGGIILVMLDITEMRRLEKVRRDFVANVSHELRTPVAVIQANAETLLDGALTHPTRGPEFASAILRNAQRLARLISDLLDLSRIESGNFTLEIQPTTVAPAVQRAVESIRGLASRKRLTVDNRITDELQVLADSIAFDQILTNLIVNAVKYTPEDGHVEIRAARGGASPSGSATVHIDVCDDGTGIEPRHRTRIFERFYRVDPGRSRDMGGTGLGLSIVKHLVVAMHGEVYVTDNPAGGSVFRVTLPAASA
ncbi:MAG TPA: ATP-binding protein [Polyangiaceae bacterium]|nr:ATP-binding protein [Polyangiaceae bacterium]